MSHSPPHRRRTRPIAIVAGLVLLTVLALAVVVAVASPRAITGTAVIAPGERLTDEQQVEASVAAFERAWNASDFDALESIVCADTRDSGEFTRREFLDARDTGGRLDLTVESIDVDGDTAIADVSNEGENNQDIALIREDGAWKWCEF